jgi:cysteine sulfinate desulfinase/cysteine desulfurase-like protein
VGRDAGQGRGGGARGQVAALLGAQVDDLGVDLLSVAGHQLYAPKGMGALYVRRGTRLGSFMRAAGQESGRRAGTEDVLAPLRRALQIRRPTS